MTSMLCNKVDGGCVTVKNDKVPFLFSPVNSNTKKIKRPSALSNPVPEHIQHFSIDVPSEHTLVEHSKQLGAWLNEKGVKQVQKLEGKLKKKMQRDGLTGLTCSFPTDFWEKTDAQARKMKRQYTSVLDTENTFVKGLDDYVKCKGFLDKRKKDILHKRWSDEVYEPVRREIIKEMDGPNYKELQRRKRELYREYLEYTNKRGHAFLNTYSPNEYYSNGLHGTRPALLKGLQAESKKLKDPTILQREKYCDEERVVLRCTSGIRYTNKDIEQINLPPLPLVPLGRHGTDSNSWIRMALTDIEGVDRQHARGKMTGLVNKVNFNLNEWAQVPQDLMAKVFDEELQISKKKRFAQPTEAIINLGHTPFGPDNEAPLVTSISRPLAVTSLSA